MTESRPGAPPVARAESVDSQHRIVRAQRLTIGRPPVVEECAVAVQVIVRLEVEGVGQWCLSASPRDLEPLALGFLFGEGLLEQSEDVEEIRIAAAGPDTRRISVRLRGEPVRRSSDDSRAAGTEMCGGDQFEAASVGTQTVAGVRLSSAELLGVHRQMVERQRVFRRTGGTHAALVFGPGGRELALAEDLTRAHAIDKAMGKCLLAGVPTAGCGVAVSGRIVAELVRTAARAGLTLVSGVSAPSHLAVVQAQARGVTLVGFARESRVTVFAHPFRITDADPSVGVTSADDAPPL